MTTEPLEPPPEIARPLQRLIDVIWSVPAPTGPPPLARDDQAFGLALLDLSLRLQHVSRMTERLRLVDPGHLDRSIGLDLDLSVLTRAQVDTLQPRPGEGGLVAGAALARPVVWVPIARHRRQDVSPVLVRDATGAVLPRLTHHEVGTRVSAGLIRLFRLLLATTPESTLEGHPLHDLRHRQNRSRWLIEHAIQRLVDSGASSHLRDVTALAGGANLAPVPRGATLEASRARTRETDSYAIRSHADRALRVLFGDPEHPFPQLLEFAATEFLLVVLVSRMTDRSFIGFDAPLLPASRPPGRPWLKNLLPVNREFTVEYTASVPRALRSYHITVDVPDEVQVRRFTVSSDLDAPLVEALLSDLDAVARRYDVLGKAGSKLLELELQSIASRLAELGRRRRLDVVGYREYLRQRFQIVPGGLPAEINRRLTADETMAAMGAGDCSPDVLGAFAGHYEADAYRHLAVGGLTPEVLRGISSGLSTGELGRDLTVDNDPRENGAHAHWKQPLTDMSAGSLEPVRATAHLALADETPALIESVSRIVAGLVLVVFCAGSLLAGDVTWVFGDPRGLNTAGLGNQADAIVAVLLVVPGILVSRLDIQSTNTVLSQLRAFQRRLAYTALVATTGLALAVAASTRGPVLLDAARLSLLVLLLTLGACRWEFVMRGRRRRTLVPRSAALPAWLQQEMLPGTPRRAADPDARFDSVEGP